MLALLEQLAIRCGDETTAEAAREAKAHDEAMAGTIGGNWTNVLSLTLASQRLPTARTDGSRLDLHAAP